MMVETILESSQDFGMSNGVLPQWKRELLQRRAARSRPPASPAPAPPPPPPPPPPADDDSEELRYGPGIVKRLKSRYLSLALRDAPRRRPSVLRRAASLEHLLDERPPPAPRARAPRPASVAAAPAAPACAARRDCVKRARSVDALSRLDSHEELAPPSPCPSPSPSPCPSAPRAARPPRRPAPLLRDAERPPPDVVRSTLRKFEGGAPRRPAPAARVAAALRGLEAARRSLTPDREPEPSSPDAVDSPSPPTASPPPLPLESPPPATSPPAPAQSPPVVASDSSPPVATFAPSLPMATFAPSPPMATFAPSSPVATFAPNPPMDTSAPSPPVAIFAPNPPVATFAPSPSVEAPAPSPPGAIIAIPTILAPVLAAVPETVAAGASVAPAAPKPASPAPPAEGPRAVSRAALEGISRAGSSVRYAFPAARAGPHLPPLAATNPVLARGARRVGVIRPMPAEPRSPEPALVNGHSTPEPRAVSRIGAAGIERAWCGAHVKRLAPGPGPLPSPVAGPAPAPWLRAGGRGRAPPAPATSVVFNFSNRKEVPDYIENDGIILRASRRNRIKGGEPGVVVLRPGAGAGSDSEGDEGDGAGAGEGRPPSPCAVRFVNDNVLINGRSSMPTRPDPARIAKLKLQFDDSLTRTFEYPSETSLCEDSPPAPAPAPAPTPTSDPAPALKEAPSEAPADAPATQLADNTHMSSAALSRYTPSKTPAAAFQLGVTRHLADVTPAHEHNGSEGAFGVGAESGACTDERPHAVPCGADAARSWSEARSLASDLLF